MKSVRILGIDPGFDRLGVAVIDKEGAQEIFIHSLSVTTSPKDPFPERLLLIGKTLKEIITTYKPDHLAIETLFVTKNQKTAMLVSQVRGVIIYLAYLGGLEVFEYSPPQIKSAITGYGKSTKDDVAFMVSKILHKSFPKNTLDDEVDAIAIALTHSANYKPFFGKTL